MKATVQNHTPHFTIIINAESELTRIQCNVDLDKTKTYQELEKKTEKYTEQIIEETIKKVQKKYKVDIFGFGDEMRHGNYQYFKKVKGNLDQEFSRATIDVKAMVTIRCAGIRTKSYLSELK